MGVVGNDSRMDCPRVSRDLVLQNLKNINFLLIFSIFQGGPTKSHVSPFLIYNKFQKCMPIFLRQVSNTYLKQSTKHLSKPNFWVKFGFPKTRVSSPVAPRGIYISRNDPNKNKKSGNARKHQKSSFVDKIYFFMPFQKLDFKELTFKELGALGYLMGVPI